jgi:hemerythrin
MFEMKDEYRLGVSQIDDQHEKLFNLGESAYKLLKDEYSLDKYDKIVAIIKELEEYTVFHFRDEEAYMESIRYKRLLSQKVEHADFIKKVSEIDLRKVDEKQDEYIMEILDFLADWLVNHIIKQDLLIVKG